MTDKFAQYSPEPETTGFSSGVAGEIAALMAVSPALGNERLLVESPSGGDAKRQLTLDVFLELIGLRQCVNDDSIPLLEGAAVYVSVGGGATLVKRAKADAAATARFDGAVSNGGPIAVSAFGGVRFDGFRALTSASVIDGGADIPAGNLVYLSPFTAGNYTATAPTATGHFVVPIGRSVFVSGGVTIVHIQRGEIEEIT